MFTAQPNQNNTRLSTSQDSHKTAEGNSIIIQERPDLSITREYPQDRTSSLRKKLFETYSAERNIINRIRERSEVKHNKLMQENLNSSNTLQMPETKIGALSTKDGNPITLGMLKDEIITFHVGKNEDMKEMVEVYLEIHKAKSLEELTETQFLKLQIVLSMYKKEIQKEVQKEMRREDLNRNEGLKESTKIPEQSDKVVEQEGFTISSILIGATTLAVLGATTLLRSRK